MIVVFILTAYVITAIIVTIYFWSEVKIAKKVFPTLKDRIFYDAGAYIYSHAFGESDDGFAFSKDDNSIRVADSPKQNYGVWLHSSFLLKIMLPIQAYYHWKYMKWLNKNVLNKKLPNYLETIRYHLAKSN